MATFTEPDCLSEDIANKVHDFNSDQFRVLLTSATPSLTAWFTLASVTGQPSAGTGYTTAVEGAGMATTMSFARTGQVTTVSHTGAGPAGSVQWTATGALGPFQWVVWWNDTPTSPANPIIGWINHGSPITMAATDTYTVPQGALFTIN
jgi:hypothetical protein